MLKRILYKYLGKLFVRVITLCFSKEYDLLILKLDVVGDYILFRNFVYEIKDSEEYFNSKIILVGNVAWKDLAEGLDGELFDKIIWVNYGELRHKLYKLKLIFHIARYRYKKVICPTYSRNFIGDNIINYVVANEKIAFVSDLSCQTKEELLETNTYYTRLIDTGHQIMFEFFRNKLFFEKFLKKDLNVKPYINKISIKEFTLINNYVVVCVDANSKQRQWDIMNFIKIAELINITWSLNIILVGKSSFLDERLIEGKKYIYNLIGKTTQLELLSVLKTAKFIISNETSIPHMAVALSTKVFVISNGNHFGRFNPYPLSITQNYFIIYHKNIEQYLHDNIHLMKMYGDGSNLNINEITIDDVWSNIMMNYVPDSDK
ncbi:MAG: glycosyltransferase family 9 protein [Burkholderiales bacterium]|nr:glycosyltransferase family 9 protein [Burkholderiales bacterium]